MYVCMYAYMHICMHAWMYVSMYACMHVCMYACMYVFNVFNVTSAPSYGCMYVCMYVYIYVCIYVCVQHSVYVPDMHTRGYTPNITLSVLHSTCVYKNASCHMWVNCIFWQCYIRPYRYVDFWISCFNTAVLARCTWSPCIFGCFPFAVRFCHRVCECVDICARMLSVMCVRMRQACATYAATLVFTKKMCLCI